MALSNIYSNLFYCGIVLLLLFGVSLSTRALIYKRGMPLIALAILLSFKLLFPIEFHFSIGVLDKGLLTTVAKWMNTPLVGFVTISMALGAIWILGACLLLIHMLCSANRVYKALSLVPQTDSKLVHEYLMGLCREKGIEPAPKVICLEHESSFIVGVRKPIIVLPASNSLDNDSMKLILSHELEHYRCHHLHIKIFIEVVAAIYWWNPLIWGIRKVVLNLLEVQADIGVTYNTNVKNRCTYAECLLAIARKTPNHRKMTTALSFNLSKQTLRLRLKAILTTRKSANGLLSTFAVGMAAAVLIFSTLFVFEPYLPNEEDIAGTFSLDRRTDYFVDLGNGYYDLYVQGSFVGQSSYIPEDFSHLACFR